MSNVLSRIGFSGRRLPRDPWLTAIEAVTLGFARIQPMKKKKTDVVLAATYGEYAAQIADYRHCGCRGGCASCQHIARDTWHG